MTKVHYSSEVVVKDSKIYRAVPIGIEKATDDEREIIDKVKPVMTFWLRSRIAVRSKMENCTILIRSKITETASSLTVDFKIQGITNERSTEHSEQPPAETEP